MQARILTGQALERARAWARARALEQALLLADLTQLADESLPAAVIDGGRLRGLACCYTGLPFLAVALWSEAPEVTAALLFTLAEHQPRLRTEPAYALVAEPILRQLALVARVEAFYEEVKLVLPRQGLTPPSPAAARWPTEPLGPQDVAALKDLYQEVPVTAWTPKTLGYGPWRGIYVADELGAAAGVHFSTPWVSELGHVATRPAYRRHGMAEAVVRAVIGDLQGHTDHIFLMHFADNEPAAQFYRRLGFVEYGRLLLTRFRVCWGT